MTFLDMVRELGRATFHVCDPQCSERMHRMEAAQLLGLLIANRQLAHHIADAADRHERKAQR